MKYKEQNGTPMYKVEHEFQLASRRGWAHSAKAKLRQFPLRLCYAQTAHKSQVPIFYFFENSIIIITNHYLFLYFRDKQSRLRTK